MKKSFLVFIIFSVVIAAFVFLVMGQQGAASAAILFGTIQQDAPLTLSQVEKMIRHGVPDSAIAIDIKKSGITFRLTVSQLAKLKSLNAGPETIKALQTILNRRKPSGESDHSPNRVTILVADFKSLSERNFGVTEKIIQQLRLATNNYPDINIQALAQPVTEQQGSNVARAIGMKHKASIVLWGYYIPTSETADINVYFEVLRKPKLLPQQQYLERQTVPISELEQIKIQIQLSRAMTYLTLLTVGFARYEQGDYKGAIDRFTSSLAQSSMPDHMINRAEIYFYRGLAYSLKGDTKEVDRAIGDFDK